MTTPKSHRDLVVELRDAWVEWVATSDAYPSERMFDAMSAILDAFFVEWPDDLD